MYNWVLPGVSWGHGFQEVVEVHNNLIQGEEVLHHHSMVVNIHHVLLRRSAILFGQIDKPMSCHDVHTKHISHQYQEFYVLWCDCIISQQVATTCLMAVFQHAAVCWHFTTAAWGRYFFLYSTLWRKILKDLETDRLTKQRLMILPMKSSGAMMVPRTIGSRYPDTTDLSGNWAGLTMVISSLPCSCITEERTTVTGGTEQGQAVRSLKCQLELRATKPLSCHNCAFANNRILLFAVWLLYCCEINIAVIHGMAVHHL